MRSPLKVVYDWLALRIKNKILFSVLTVFVLIYGATLSYTYNRTREDLLQAAVAEALSTTRVLALTLYRNYEIEHDVREIQSYVFAAGKYKSSLIEINVLDRELTYVSSTDEDKLLERAVGQTYSDALANTSHIELVLDAVPPHINIVYPVSAGVGVDNYVTGAVEIRSSLHAQFSYLDSMRTNTLVAGAAILLAIALVITLISHSITRPIQHLYAGMEKANEGDLHIQVPVVSGDEIGYLTTTFNHMIGSIRVSNEKIVAMMESSRRFVPEPFLSALGRSDITDVQLGDAILRDMTVFFLDIRGFTNMSERMSAHETLVFLNSLMERVLPAISRNGGFIDKFIGDAVMALFPARPDDALLAAIELRGYMADFNRERAGDGGVAIDLGIGINSGELILGTLGSTQRIDTTVIGNTVNIASRLESLTKEHKVPIILPEAVFLSMDSQTRERVNYRDLGPVEIRGIAAPVRLVGVLA